MHWLITHTWSLASLSVDLRQLMGGIENDRSWLELLTVTVTASFQADTTGCQNTNKLSLVSARNLPFNRSQYQDSWDRSGAHLGTFWYVHTANLVQVASQRPRPPRTASIMNASFHRETSIRYFNMSMSIILTATWFKFLEMWMMKEGIIWSRKCAWQASRSHDSAAFRIKQISTEWSLLS